MFTFIRAQFASIAATIVDFLITICLVEGFHCWYVVGTATGMIAGGFMHFMIGRKWVFNADEGHIRQQAVKYLLVWIVYLLLSTAGVYLVTHYAGVEYIVSKVLVAVLMSVGFNYRLHKKFVFK